MTMPRTVLGLLLVCAMLSIALPARAEMCRIADPTDTSLNVRDTPGGKVINKLRNGRKVFIDAGLDQFDEDQRANAYAIRLLDLGRPEAVPATRARMP